MIKEQREYLKSYSQISVIHLFRYSEIHILCKIKSKKKQQIIVLYQSSRYRIIAKSIKHLYFSQRTCRNETIEFVSLWPQILLNKKNLLMLVFSSPNRRNYRSDCIISLPNILDFRIIRSRKFKSGTSSPENCYFLEKKTTSHVDASLDSTIISGVNQSVYFLSSSSSNFLSHLRFI